MSVEPGFDWQKLRHLYSAMSLFSQKQLIEIRLTSGKPGETGSRILQDFMQAPPPDVVVMVLCGNLDKRSQNVKWLKAVEKTGLVVEHPALNARQLSAWIEHRMDALGLQHDADIVSLLLYYLEGNLLAVDQEIRKLKLTFGEGQPSADAVLEGITDMGRFSVYNLIDACHLGDAKRALRILNCLQSEAEEPVLINWALARELRLLIRLQSQLSSKMNYSQVFRQNGVWKNRSALLTATLKRLRSVALRQLLVQVAISDQSVKGRPPESRVGNFWQNLEQIALGWCGINTV